MNLSIRLVFIGTFCLASAAIAQPNSDQLIDALQAADIKAVELALKRGASPVTPIGRTSAPAYPRSPLQWLLNQISIDESPAVVDAKKIRVARLLIARGAKVEPNDDAMYFAVAEGHIEVAALMLDAKQDINRRIGGYLPTELAAMRGHQDLYRRLIARGGKDLSQPELTQLSLMQGVNKLDVDLVAKAIAAGADVNALDPSGQTALTTILIVPVLWQEREQTTRNLEFLGTLLNKFKANPAIPSGGDQRNYPIIQWVEMNSYVKDQFDLSAQVVTALIKLGADVNVVDTLNQTALHKAAQKGNFPAATALAEAGINHKIKDYRGRTALDLASDTAMRTFLRKLP